MAFNGLWGRPAALCCMGLKNMNDFLRAFVNGYMIGLSLGRWRRPAYITSEA
jgi:hypothetical protein